MRGRIGEGIVTGQTTPKLVWVGTALDTGAEAEAEAEAVSEAVMGLTQTGEGRRP